MPVNMGEDYPVAAKPGLPTLRCMPTVAPNALAGLRLTAPPPGFVDDPYPFYAALRDACPVHALGPGSWLLTRYDDVLAVYRSAAVSSDKQREFGAKFGVGTPLHQHHTTSLVFNDPPRHTRVRRLLMGALGQQTVQRMQAGVVALVDALLDRLADAPAPDLVADFAARIPVEVIGNLLAVPKDQREPLRGWSLAILWALEPAPDAQVLSRGHAAVEQFTTFLRGLVAERRARPGDPDTDVLTRLLQGDDEGPLDEAELLHNCIFLLNAGHETTTNLIGNGLHALMTHRRELDRLLAAPALIGSAVEELLRFESPIQLNNRVATAPLWLAGQQIAAGDFITLAIGAANRDPAVFSTPAMLDITRRPNNHLAFGQGAHACSGMNVARLEARMAIGRLLARYPRIHLAGAPQRDPRLRFRGFRRLPVALG
jgi:cytochrome P450